MAKFNVTLTSTVTVSTDGKAQMSEDFRLRLLDSARKLAKDTGITIGDIARQDAHALAFLVSGKAVRQFVSAFSQVVDTMTAYGPESDILNALFDKRPELRNHPRVAELVSSFDRLVAKVHELEKDTKSTPSVARPVPGNGPQRKMTQAEIMQDREQKLKGQAPHQVPKSSTDDLSVRSIVTPPREHATNIFATGDTGENGSKA